MNKSFYAMLIMAFCFSCGDKTKENPSSDEKNQLQNESKIVEIDFHKNQFVSNERQLLNELDSLQFFNSLPQRIFIEIPPEKRNQLLSEKYFNFIPLFLNKPISEGFIMTVSGELFLDRKFSTMTNRSFVFERVNSSLVLVNSFKGFIKELRTNGSSIPSDLVLEFNSEKENAYFYCLYNWQDGKYQFNKCIGLSEDKGNTVFKYTDLQSIEYSSDIKLIIEKENFAF